MTITGPITSVKIKKVGKDHGVSRIRFKVKNPGGEALRFSIRSDYHPKALMPVFTECVMAAYVGGKDIVVEYPGAADMDGDAFLPNALQFPDAESRTLDQSTSPILPPANIAYFNAKRGNNQDGTISFILTTPGGHDEDPSKRTYAFSTTTIAKPKRFQAMAHITLGAYLFHQEVDFEFVEVAAPDGTVQYHVTSIRLYEPPPSSS